MNRGPGDHGAALFQITAWYRTGDRALSKPVMTQSPTANKHQQSSISQAGLLLRVYNIHYITYHTIIYPCRDPNIVQVRRGEVAYHTTQVMVAVCLNTASTFSIKESKPVSLNSWQRLILSCSNVIPWYKYTWYIHLSLHLNAAIFRPCDRVEKLPDLAMQGNPPAPTPHPPRHRGSDMPVWQIWSRFDKFEHIAQYLRNYYI